MSEGAILLLVILALFVGYSYFGSGNSSTASGNASHGSLRGSRRVTKDMIEVVQSMFPTISERSIAYDLSKTGSVEATTEKLLTSNTLPEPPATYVYMFAPSQPVQQPSGRASSAQKGHSYPDLITRFHLNDKVKSGLYAKPEPLGIQWSDSKAEREAMFKRKREQFILQGLKNQKSFEKTKLSAASHE